MKKVSPLPFPVSRSCYIPFDILFWATAVSVAAILRFEFRFELLEPVPLGLITALLAGCNLIAGHTAHLYLNRFAVGSIGELRALTLTTFYVTMVVGTSALFFGNLLGIPRSIVLIASPLFFLQSGGLRLYLRFLRQRRHHSGSVIAPALVYGAGDAGESLIVQLQTVPNPPFIAVGLLDDDPEKQNLWLRGVPMMGNWSDLAEAQRKTGATTLIVCIPEADSSIFARAFEECRSLGMKVVVLPSLRESLGVAAKVENLGGVTLEDLVGRKQVVLEVDKVLHLLQGRRVLVTGAGGSIGSELSLQISDYSPSSLVLVDRDETLLLETESRFAEKEHQVSFVSRLLDIRDLDAVSKAFETHLPDVVFHAAALKHLPILERFPDEAWKTNVVGTINVVSSAARSGCKIFVNISTDKVADPANVLGRSKLLGDRVVSWFANETRMPLISVRFGNVLGSRGSLVPVLANRIRRGGPVELTHPEATRFFMSISEACQLVLQAASQGEGGMFWSWT